MRKIIFFKPYFSSLNIFVKKAKDPDLDPYLWQKDPDPDTRIRFLIRIPNTAKKYCFELKDLKKIFISWHYPFSTAPSFPEIVHFLNWHENFILAFIGTVICHMFASRKREILSL